MRLQTFWKACWVLLPVDGTAESQLRKIVISPLLTTQLCETCVFRFFSNEVFKGDRFERGSVKFVGYACAAWISKTSLQDIPVQKLLGLLHNGWFTNIFCH